MNKLQGRLLLLFWSVTYISLIVTLCFSLQYAWSELWTFTNFILLIILTPVLDCTGNLWRGEEIKKGDCRFYK
jgi:hypothetical protein